MDRMSTLEATISMLEAMPEPARLKVMEYTQELFTAGRSDSPFAPMTAGEILSDLEASRRQIADGQGREMGEALTELGRRHGFL